MVSDRGHGGHWRVIAAVVGYVIVCPDLLLAQTPEGRRVPHPSPAVEGQAQREAERGGRQPEPPPVPVRIIRSVDEAEHDAAREAKADEHDAQDLNAQIRAANAAEEQVPIAKWAVALSALATGLLVWTLWETRKANRIARDAYIADQRPWLTVRARVASDLTRIHSGFQIQLWLLIKNTGKSPATHVFADAKGLARDELSDVRADQRKYAKTMAPRSDAAGWTLFPGQDVLLYVNATIENSEIEKYQIRDLVYEGREFVPIFIGNVYYKNVLDGRSMNTGFTHHLRRDGTGTAWISPMEGAVARAA